MELTPATPAPGWTAGPGPGAVLGSDRGARVTEVARDHGAALAELKARMASASSCSRLLDFSAVPVNPAHAWDQFHAWPDARCYQVTLVPPVPGDTEARPPDAEVLPYFNAPRHRANLAVFAREAERIEKPALAARLREAGHVLAPDRHT
ncbi:hypothetical protein [Catenulispora rubra]|uniref:hypothetical protein n=1 Tax=Catenulispora rubra TaxID=280293 RepID=UPI001891F3DC|nr:hypothetical protein [Catenulispora rubra]